MIKMALLTKAALPMAVMLTAVSLALAQVQQPPTVQKTAKTEPCSFAAIGPEKKEQYCLRKASKPPGTASTKAKGAVARAPTGLVLKPSASLRADSAAKVAGELPVPNGAAKPIPVAKAAPMAAPIATAAPAKPTPAPAVQEAVAPAPTVLPAAPLATAAVPATPAAARAEPATAPGNVVAAPTETSRVMVAAGPPRKLASDDAARRYADGLELERRGEPQAAMTAYLDAAESGNGPAQKKLGDIYGTGTSFVERDYETALKWYQRARQQGIEIPRPFTFPGVRQ